ncbi:Uncharacterised protein [Klebsiella pneumoniae]|nr:Uncharacterised protein [Klebsiella pneumoniae]
MVHKHFEDTIKLSKQATAFNEELFANECAVGDVLVLVGFLDLDKDFFYLFEISLRSFGRLS